VFDVFFPILMLALIVGGIAAAFIFLSIVLGKRTQLGAKGDPYECGIPPAGSTKDPVPVKFYMVAISFILFDIEVVFLYPYAVVARQLGLFGFIEILIFITLIMIGYFYELGRGAFTWD